MQIQSFPSHPNDEAGVHSLRVIQVTRDPPPIIVNCSLSGQDSQTGLINASVTWVYPFELPILEVTRFIVVTTQFVKGNFSGVSAPFVENPRIVPTKVSYSLFSKILGTFCSIVYYCCNES